MGEERFRRITEEILGSTAVEVNCSGRAPEKDDARTAWEAKNKSVWIQGEHLILKRKGSIC